MTARLLRSLRPVRSSSIIRTISQSYRPAYQASQPVRAATAAAASSPASKSSTTTNNSNGANTPSSSSSSSSSSPTIEARKRLPAVSKSTKAVPGRSTRFLDPQPAHSPAASADVDAPFAAVPEPTADDASTEVSNNGNGSATINWSNSFHGLSTEPFPAEVAEVLMQPLESEDVEIKPDGIIYLPEIKYRRILNKAFGPGGWGLAPRGQLTVGDKVVTREYALVVHGRFIAEARGECQYFSEETIPTAGEGCKSNALLRCCKDLGVASELWDPRFIRSFKKTHCREVWVEHSINKKKRQIWLRKDCDPAYPYQKPTQGKA